VKKRPEDVENALDEAISEQLRTGEWRVYPHYERRELGNGDVYMYAPPWWIDETNPEMLELYRRLKQVREKDESHDVEFASYMSAQQVGILQEENEPWLYKPLIDEPDLFLKFARLVEEGPITDEVMLEWVRSYGVVGLDKFAGSAGMGNPRGGPSESVLGFGERAEEANMVLRLYEAARSPYGPDISTIKKHITMPEVPHQQARLARPNARKTVTSEGTKVTIVEQSPLSKPPVLDLIGDSLQEIAVKQRSKNNLGQIALVAVKQIVSERLAAECSQGLHPQEDDTYRQGWRFKSLLGAMYFQMASLISYTGKTRVCRAPGCFRIISLEKPEPYLDKQSGKMVSPRKPRSDKILCGRDACEKRYERSR
jgi:hypothetical protein